MADSPTRRRLIILGSTGSIGCNTLAVVEHLNTRTEFGFEVVGLASGRNAARLAEQARRFDVAHVAIADEGGRESLTDFSHVFAGKDAAEALVASVARPGDLVVGAMVGSVGLPAVMESIRAGCDIALANKETLVAAGAIVMPLVRKYDVHLLPIDSEHSAIFQCLLAGRSMDEVRRVVLTASGGPFREATRAEMDHATVEQTLAHPTWNMGPKVTIDSATLMNKALEVIEAHWLFDLEADQIDAIIHPQSIVHSFVEFVDGTVFAQLSPPDMKSPIQYALTWPRRAEGVSRPIDWSAFRGLEFLPVDHDRFPAIMLAKQVIKRGGTAGAVFNAANEVAVEAFLDRRIPYGCITRIVRQTVDMIPTREAGTLDSVFAADLEARAAADELVRARANPEPSTVL